MAPRTDVPDAEAAVRHPRTLRRFAAAYRGDHDPTDALWWLGHPLDPAPSGRPAPRRSALALHATLYARGAEAGARERYAAALAGIEADEQLARAALASAVPGGRGRWRMPAAAAMIGLAAAAVAPWLLPQHAPAPSLGAESTHLSAAFAAARPVSTDVRTVMHLLRSEDGSATGAEATTGAAVGPVTVPLRAVGTLATGRRLRVTLACPVATRFSWSVRTAPLAADAPHPQPLTALGSCGPRFTRTAVAVPSGVRADVLRITVPPSAVVLYAAAVR